VEASGRIDERIQLCLSSLNYPPFFGGAALRFARYLPGLAARGIDTRVFACLPLVRPGESFSGGEPPPGEPGTLLPADPVNGTPVHRLVLKSPRMRGQLGLYARRLRAFCLDGSRRPDVVHILNLHKSDLPTLRALRAAGIPVVYSLTLIGRHSTNPIRRFYQDTLLRFPYRFVDAVVTSTDVMRDWLRSYGVTQRIEVIPNGVDLNRFQPARAAEGASVRAALGIGPGERVVLTVGSVQPRKRTDLLVRAWIAQRRLGIRSHLVVAGPIHDNKDPRSEYLMSLVAMARSAGLEKELHFVGSVDDIEDYFHAADLFVLTTEREGMNNAIFEAMASGVPVLTVPFEGLTAAHGTPGVHYSLARAEPDALAAAMDEILASDAVRAGLAAGGLGWARSEADVERVLDRYALLYRELVGAARAPERRRRFPSWRGSRPGAGAHAL
jgi:hypothetical protein